MHWTRACAHAPHTSVLLGHLPSSVLPGDILRTAGGAVPLRMDVLRTPTLHASEDTGHYGTFALSEADAAGRLRMHYARHPKELLSALDTIAAEPLRTAVLRNLPPQTTAAKLDRKLRRSYNLAGEDAQTAPVDTASLGPLGGARRLSSILARVADIDEHIPTADFPNVVQLPALRPGSTSSAFLVRMANISEAMRLV
ncbi:hypothetical protein MSPP1_001051 [Malassezia sp. CBS 17886]|nr:hypothetical protein MSPP1_001051 [Malassezia sp. CBS 17886]